MKKINMFRIISVASALVIALFIPLSAHAQDFWQGATSSDPTVASNWYQGTAPTIGGTQTTQIVLQNDSLGGNPLIYNSSYGTTTFGYLYGEEFGAGGTLSVTGGTINFGVTGGGGAQNALGLVAPPATVNVSGGTVNFRAGDVGDGTSLWIGNAGNATVNLSSGLITTQFGLDFARDGGTGILNISGGLFNVQGLGGTIAKNASGGGTAILDFKTGSGVFQESTSAIFASGVQVKFDFQTGGAFELTSVTNPFDAQAAAGQLYYQTTSSGTYTQLDNVSTDPNYYLNYLSVSSGAGNQTLSVIPEPSTWAMLLGGLGMLTMFRRRRTALKAE